MFYNNPNRAHSRTYRTNNSVCDRWATLASAKLPQGYTATAHGDSILVAKQGSKDQVRYRRDYKVARVEHYKATHYGQEVFDLGRCCSVDTLVAKATKALG